MAPVLLLEGVAAVRGGLPWRGGSGRVAARARPGPFAYLRGPGRSAELTPVRRRCANPLYRLMMTSFEIFPVGLLIAVVSAALLRNPKVLAARSRAAAA